MKIEHILKLARLKVSTQEKRELEKDFSSILDFVRKLQTLDIRKIKPMKYPVTLQNIMREDKPKRKEQRAKSKKLLNLSPRAKEGYIKVKQVL